MSDGRAAVFLDRDGTICREVDFLTDPDELELLPGAADAIGKLNAHGLPVVVVTNQSGIARGYLTEETLARIHDRMEAELARHDARVDAVYYCPHHPDAVEERYRKLCDCRKPKPGMLERAAREMNLALESSWVVGDSLRDLEAGRAVGVRGILVATGKTAEAERGISFCADLPSAVDSILGE